MEHDKHDDGLNSEYGRMTDKLFGKKKRSASEEALINDRRIENAVLYVLTKGYTQMMDTGITAMLNAQADPEKAQEAMKKKNDYNDSITEMFKDFKNMIRVGEITLEELEEKVYADYGVVSEQFRRQANPLEFDPEVKYMSDEDYKLMRESYDGEEKTEK